MNRRLPYLIMAVVTIALGLGVRFAGSGLPPDARDVAGDLLWAVMMYWWVAAVAPGRRPSLVAAVTLGICFAVELSQIYHAPWIDGLRANLLARLVLGTDFDARDLVAYTAGVALAWLAAVTLMRTRINRG